MNRMPKLPAIVVLCVLTLLALVARAQSRVDLGTQVQGVLPAANGGSAALIATAFPGADIGAQIDAAYAACSANTGCAIVVPPPPGGSFYTMATPIVFGTSGKNVSLDCMVSSGPENGAIHFTGAGVAVTVDTGSGTNPAHGVSSINNCQFFGLNANGSHPGNTQVGLRLGLSPTVATTNGAIGFHLGNSNFFGFGTGVEWGANTWGTLFTNSWFYNNTVELSFLSPYDSGENMMMTGGGISGGTLQLAGMADFHFSQVSFDATQIHSSALRANFVQCHFEDYAASSLPFIVATNGAVSLTDSTMLQDASTGSVGGPMIAASGTTRVVVRGLFAGSNLRLPNLFSLSGTATLEELSPAGLSNGTYDTASPVANAGAGEWTFEESPGVFLGTMKLPSSSGWASGIESTTWVAALSAAIADGPCLVTHVWSGTGKLYWSSAVCHYANGGGSSRVYTTTAAYPIGAEVWVLGEQITGTGATFPSILGPLTAPAGPCTTKGAWVFSQEGHATYCNGSVWVTKI
jgi:hypothetical protein